MRRGHDEFYTVPFDLIFGGGEILPKVEKNYMGIHLDVPTVFSANERNNSMPTIQTFTRQKI